MTMLRISVAMTVYNRLRMRECYAMQCNADTIEQRTLLFTIECVYTHADQDEDVGVRNCVEWYRTYYTGQMIIPIRCFTCGKVLANKWRSYERRSRTSKGDEERARILNELGLTRICCRTVMLTTVDMTMIL
jgi:DNA-directed RNA polymerase subunit N (RpoN/RPB10)